MGPPTRGRIPETRMDFPESGVASAECGVPDSEGDSLGLTVTGTVQEVFRHCLGEDCPDCT